MQAWHAWAVMNFEAVLHYKHQNQGRDEKKKLRHASGASATSEASNSDSEVDSNDHSPVPSPGQKKVNEVRIKVNFSARQESSTLSPLFYAKLELSGEAETVLKGRSDPQGIVAHCDITVGRYILQATKGTE